MRSSASRTIQSSTRTMIDETEHTAGRQRQGEVLTRFVAASGGFLIFALVQSSGEMDFLIEKKK